MELPKIIQKKVEQKIKNVKLSELRKVSEQISNKYLGNKLGTNKSILNNELEALVYSIMRMPATFAANTKVLEYVFRKVSPKEINNIIDIGAGVGTSAWAILKYINNPNILCIEKQKNMQSLGMYFMKNEQELRNVQWENLDILNDVIDKKADLVTCSYVINEIPKERRLDIVNKIINLTNNVAIIIEPGTPSGFENIKLIKQYAIKKRSIYNSTLYIKRTNM